MILICKKSVLAFETDILFTKGSAYEFEPLDNRYTRINGFNGYVKKDDEGYKRWLTEEFMKEHFEKN